jgi:hypothetical protein
VRDHFPHYGRQRRAGQVGPSDEAAAFRFGGALRLGIEPDAGAIDRKFKMKMGEGVLDQARELLPVGLERRMIARRLPVRLLVLPGR